MSKYTTPAERIEQLRLRYGSYRKAAKALGVSYPYLHRVASGNKEAGDGLLAKLGLEKQVRYLRIVA